MSPIASIRVFLALSLIYDLHIHQMDVKISFLNGDLSEKMYMRQPERFVILENKKKIYKLIKSLYGLKQAQK